MPPATASQRRAIAAAPSPRYANRMASPDPTVVHEPGRFVARIDGQEAYVEYERDGDVLDVLHTWTPPSLRGRDVAARVTDAVVAYARAEGLRIRPSCPYTRAYFDRRPELEDLVE
jgi:uncharacterized protein